MAGCRATCGGWTENKELRMDKENAGEEGTISQSGYSEQEARCEDNRRQRFGRVTW